MKWFLTSIYDHVAKVYTNPAASHNTAVAVRAFVQAANDKAHAIGCNPGDYTMFVTGEFDDETGDVTPFKEHRSLGLAASYVKVRLPSGPDHDVPNAQELHDDVRRQKSA